MTNSASPTTTASKSFELKASSLTIPVIRLLDNKLEQLADELQTRVDATPDFFRNAPMVIDLAAFPIRDHADDMAMIVGVIRSMGIMPIGIQGGSEAHIDAAEMLELAVLGNTRPKNKKPRNNKVTPVQNTHAVSAKSETLFVNRPVRSGQRIYAKGGDLVVNATVSSGAELIADGFIHVYGALRGRALAGVSGRIDARIYCQQMHAELVSIAGRYKSSDRLEDALVGQSVQFYLQEDKLVGTEI